MRKVLPLIIVAASLFSCYCFFFTNYKLEAIVLMLIASNVMLKLDIKELKEKKKIK